MSRFHTFTLSASALVLSGVALASTANAQGTAACVNLETAIDAALSYDPRIDQAIAGTELARSEVISAFSRNLPTVSAFGQYGFDDVPPLESRRDDQVGLQVSQELYSFGSRKWANRAAEARLTAAEYGVSGTKVDIARGAALAFLDYFRAENLVALQAEQEKTFGEDASTADSRLSRQVITLTDASQIKARFARARSETINARVEAEVAKERLALLIDRDVSCLDQNSIEHFIEPRAEWALGLAPSAAIDEAFARSPVLKSAKAEIKAAEASRKEASRAGMPVVSLNAYSVYGWDETTDLAGNTTRDGDQETRVGLAFSSDLFAGGRNRAQRVAAKARVQSAEAGAALDRLSVEDSVRRALARAKARRAAGLSFFEARRESRVQLDATQRQYELGTRTLTDLVLATEDYYIAATQELNARYDFYASLIDLYASMGVLTAPVE